MPVVPKLPYGKFGIIKLRPK